MQFKTKAEVPSRWSTYMHRSLGSSAVQPWVLSYWIRLPEYNIQKKSFFLSLEVFPHRFQPSVSGYSEKECALAHSRAEARLLQQPSTLAPSAHPRGAFLSYGNEVSYTIKKRHSRNCHAVFRKNLHSAGALRRRNREANVQFGSAIIATLWRLRHK